MNQVIIIKLIKYIYKIFEYGSLNWIKYAHQNCSCWNELVYYSIAISGNLDCN